MVLIWKWFLSEWYILLLLCTIVASKLKRRWRERVLIRGLVFLLSFCSLFEGNCFTNPFSSPCRQRYKQEHTREAPQNSRPAALPPHLPPVWLCAPQPLWCVCLVLQIFQTKDFHPCDPWFDFDAKLKLGKFGNMLKATSYPAIKSISQRQLFLLHQKITGLAKGWSTLKTSLHSAILGLFHAFMAAVERLQEMRGKRRTSKILRPQARHKPATLQLMISALTLRPPVCHLYWGKKQLTPFYTWIRVKHNQNKPYRALNTFESNLKNKEWADG